MLPAFFYTLDKKAQEKFLSEHPEFLREMEVADPDDKHMASGIRGFNFSSLAEAVEGRMASTPTSH